jgi:hypothetical protein
VLAKAMGKLRQLEQVIVSRAETKLDSPELERELMRQLAELEDAPPPPLPSPNSSFGNAPGSSASTPAS